MSDPRDDLDRDDELLAELRDAWRAAAPPDPERGAGDGADAAVTAWLRGAWDALDAPSPSQEAIRRLVPRAAPVVATGRRITPLGAWIGLAAAAALVVWLAIADASRDDGDGRDGIAVAVAPTDQDTPRPTPDPAPIEVVDVTPERMELQSGPVRLVLLNEWSETTVTDER